MKNRKLFTLLTCLAITLTLAGVAWLSTPTDAEDCCFGSYRSSQQWVMVNDCSEAAEAIRTAAWSEANSTCGMLSSPCSVVVVVEACHAEGGQFVADGYIRFGCFDPINCTLTP